MPSTIHFKFTKSQRLLTPKDYQGMTPQRHVPITKPKPGFSFKVHQDNLLIFVKFLNPQLSPIPNRLGLAITKKKVKRAHERNRIKRLTREYFRLHQHELPGQIDMLLTIKQFSDDLQNDVIVEQLANSFRLIKDKVNRNLL